MGNCIGLNINNLCKQNFLSKKEFADLFEVSLSTINTYTRGRSTPPVDLIQKICSHFEITIDDFINTDLSTKATTKIEKLQQNVNEPGTAYEKEENNKKAMRETIESLKETVETQKELIKQYRKLLAEK